MGRLLSFACVFPGHLGIHALDGGPSPVSGATNAETRAGTWWPRGSATYTPRTQSLESSADPHGSESTRWVLALAEETPVTEPRDSAQ